LTKPAEAVPRAYAFKTVTLCLGGSVCEIGAGATRELGIDPDAFEERLIELLTHAGSEK
jgi:hypothetical protein